VRRRGRAADRRPPAVAGTFYPADADELSRVVDDELARAAARRSPDPGDESRLRRPKALIAPHAGYAYSGPVAATAYHRLVDLSPPVRRVVLIGPAHRAALVGLAAPTANAFATPLGPIPIDEPMRQIVAAHPSVTVDDRAHRGEHSLEVHLPFLQRALVPGWTLLPLVVGDAKAADVADVLDRCWGGPETVIVASSDLSHYLDHDTATSTDRRTADLILDRRAEALDPRDACGARGVAGLLEAARRHELDVDLLDLRTSGDTAGSKERDVGYGAFALS
jgi:AmmeMemoRadiSam system protein B